MKTKKRLEDYSWEELLEATSTKESYKEAGRASAEYTMETKTGIHTDDEELRKEWARMGGETSIDNLLNWQKENNHNIGEIAKLKNEDWKMKIGISNKGKTHTEEFKQRVSKIINGINSNLSKEEKIKKYSNDSSTRKALRIHTEILNTIPTDIFNTQDAKIACEQYGLGNWKGFLKNTNIIKQLHKGTNKYNPSIYQKIK